jgi:N-acyl amino acid synthase of PEP-CTERM/exosortase system
MSHTYKTEPGDRFNRYFKIAPALCDDVRNEVFHIRHDVYAREFGFEPVQPNERESDHYDRHSLHCIVKTNESDSSLVGCARIVMPDPLAPQALLPFEIACQGTLDRSIIDPARLPRQRIAEVSRLAVMSGFRRRKGEKLSADVTLSENDFGGADVPRFPNIPLSLYAAAVLMAQRHGIDYLFVLTEPRLSKHFAKFGVNIMPIGAPIEFHGTRVPSVMRVEEIYPGLRSLFRPIWHAIEQQLDDAYSNVDAPAHQVQAQQSRLVRDLELALH